MEDFSFGQISSLIAALDFKIEYLQKSIDALDDDDTSFESIEHQISSLLFLKNKLSKYL